MKFLIPYRSKDGYNYHVCGSEPHHAFESIRQRDALIDSYRRMQSEDDPHYDDENEINKRVNHFAVISQKKLRFIRAGYINFPCVSDSHSDGASDFVINLCIAHAKEIIPK